MESDISKTEQGDPVPKDERKKKLLGGGATKGGSTVTEWDQATQRVMATTRGAG
jgi:hypothetical protein